MVTGRLKEKWDAKRIRNGSSNGGTKESAPYGSGGYRPNLGNQFPVSLQDGLARG
jgi:hypothetical protein